MRIRLGFSHTSLVYRGYHAEVQEGQGDLGAGQQVEGSLARS